MTANSLTAMSPQYWAKRMGYKMYKTNVFRSIASFEEKPTLYNGQIVDRPYRSDVVVENYSKGTAATAQDLTATDDTLTVNKFKDILMYVDRVDKIQNKYDAVNLWGDEAGIRLANAIDAEVLYETINAGKTLDAGDVGGTTGQGVALTTSNILDLFAAASRKLDLQNVPIDQRKAVISPHFKEQLWKYIAGRWGMLGDKTAENGSLGTFDNFQLYLSNNLMGSARWTPASNPANLDTITINSIVFTFVSTIGSTAGNVLQTVSTAVTITNLVTLINAPSTTTATGVALSAANVRTVQQWVAVDGTTYADVRVKGGSYLTVSSSVAGQWGATTQLQHNWFGRANAIDVVIQKEPDVEIASMLSAGKFGVNVGALTLFGTKTFNLGAQQMVDVQIKSSSFTS